MKTAIVYYSMGGNTHRAAEAIARHLDADLIRLRPVKAYPDKGLRKFFYGGKSAVMQESPALEPYSFDAGQYGRVIFGSPIWAGTITPPLRTFIRENGEALAGKRLAAFFCSGGGSAEKALKKLKEALGADKMDAHLLLTEPRPAAEKEKQISAFCDSLT